MLAAASAVAAEAVAAETVAVVKYTDSRAKSSFRY